MRAIKTLDESTPVRVGLVVIIVGAASWITLIYASVTDSQQALKVLTQRVNDQEAKTSDMQGDLKVVKSILVREFGD